MPIALDTLQDRVTALVQGVLDGGPCYAVEIVVRGSMGSHAVDVFVESDTVLDVRTLAKISREVGFGLDLEDVMPGPYTLNVSSPGTDRPLRLPRQYRKMVGRALRVHYRLPDSKYTEVVGTLEGVDVEGITVAARKSPLSIQFSDILWAKVQLPW